MGIEASLIVNGNNFDTYGSRRRGLSGMSVCAKVVPGKMGSCNWDSHLRLLLNGTDFPSAGQFNGRCDPRFDPDDRNSCASCKLSTAHLTFYDGCRHACRPACSVQPQAPCRRPRAGLPLLPWRRRRRAAFAGLPPTHTCMTCHSQLFTNAAMLAPVRKSLAKGVPLRWNRVYLLPDYVYFDHSVHVRNGIGCTTCHGDDEQHAADGEKDAPDDGLVPRLPPRPWRPYAPRGGDLRSRTARCRQ